ncbi:MAG: sugar transferase [Hominisplanchenecus sp.]
MLVPLCVNGSRKRQLAITVISACLLSGLVESLQLLLKLGFTEFNDVFDNTLGTAFGTVIVLMLERVKRVNMYAKFFKRFLDFILSLCAVIVLSPVLLILIVLGTIFMRGNPFFFQERPGMDEKIFKLIKFRTMDNRRGAEGNLLPDSVRLNKYGRFLRSTSLDELPELFNILKGDMSIIGPRPLLPRDVAYMNDVQHQRHIVRPGLTGLAQCSGRNSMNWDVKLATDIEYVTNLSFRLDCRIFLLTIVKVLKREDVEFDEGADMDLKDWNELKKRKEVQDGVKSINTCSK